MTTQDHQIPKEEKKVDRETKEWIQRKEKKAEGRGERRRKRQKT